MIKVFMEYKIKEDFLSYYQETMREIKKLMLQNKAAHYQHFEGTDQPLLFVEMFDVETMDDYLFLKKLRCQDHPMIENYVLGGKEKIHMWAFKETDYA